MDSTKNKTKKDYTHIKKVLDRALFTFGNSGGYIRTHKKRQGVACFGHNTNFCCLQQPTTSEKDEFYVIQYMNEFRRDLQLLRMKNRIRQTCHGCWNYALEIIINCIIIIPCSLLTFIFLCYNCNVNCQVHVHVNCHLEVCQVHVNCLRWKTHMQVSSINPKCSQYASRTNPCVMDDMFS